ncbi:MAG: amidohydrolase family protein [bacterium]|nr:amidohydrolase family protein [bacterium]
MLHRIVLIPAILCFACLVIAPAVDAQDRPRYSHTGSALVSDIRVVDGLGNEPVEHQDIVISDGKIGAIGPTGTLDVPSDALTIAGQGLTAMPGLIDMHIHLQGSWAHGNLEGEQYAIRYDDEAIQQRLNGYLYAGVTTLQEMGNDYDFALKNRNRINNGEMLGPRFFTTALPWSQLPTGWESLDTGGGAAFNISNKVDDLTTIGARLDRYKADKIEMIKLYTGISHHAARFLIKEAHARGIKTVADLWDLNLDKVFMMATGLDGWAHSAGFEIATRDDQEWMAAHDRFVVVTANVGEKLSGLRVADEQGQRLQLQEPLIVDIWGREVVEDFYNKYPQLRENLWEGPHSFYQQMGFGKMTRFRANFLTNIKGSHDAGVLIAGGSDDSFPSLWPGESMHRELELLVMAGISPIDAIKICTHNGSRILGREDKFGSLQAGLSADILIVKGNPAENISDTRNVREVFLRGKRIDRDSLKLTP